MTQADYESSLTAEIADDTTVEYNTGLLYGLTDRPPLVRQLLLRFSMF